jgi:hypothetical protein
MLSGITVHDNTVNICCSTGRLPCSFFRLIEGPLATTYTVWIDPRIFGLTCGRIITWDSATYPLPQCRVIGFRA